MNTDKHRWDHLTEVIPGCAYRVSNELGCGFPEIVHENALAHEITKAGLRVETQNVMTIHHDGIVVGE